MNIDDMKDLDEATRKEIEELQKVTRERDGGEAFAEAQYNIGVALEKSKNIEEAVSVWNDLRHVDSPKKYAQAQLHIGFISHKNNNIEDALSVWCDIKRNDNPNAYAKAQFNIGLILEKNKNFEESLAVWLDIKREDSPETYAKAQANIGNILFQNNKTEDAILVWNKIDRKDDSKVYAKVHFEIGALLDAMGDVERALSTWDNINYEDDLEIYLKAQLEIGKISFQIGKISFQIGNIEQALLALCKIKYLDKPEIYSEAQWYMSGILLSYGYEEDAMSLWHSIKRIDNSEVYVSAQFLIGLALIEKKDFQKAFLAWSNIESTDEPKIYAQAQFNIGKYLIFITDSSNSRNIKESIVSKDDLKKAEIAFTNSKPFYPYESYCYIQICRLLLNEDKSIFGTKLQEFFEEIVLITKELTLSFEDENIDEEDPERKIAHYTSTYVADILLNNNNKNKTSGSFRLNTINNVNDSSEGHILNNYLSNEEEVLYSPNFDKNFQSFISCFTFNHDSLNQFRLYGKKDNQEASGISLVFNKSFFQTKNILDGVSFLSSLGSTQSLINVKNKEFLETKINMKPVMRCIYIEPVSKYIQLAQRNRLTFYREFGAIGCPEDKWNNYQESMIEKTKNVKTSLEKLKHIYQDIKIKHTDDSNEYSDFINKTLLPLKYLGNPPNK